MDLGAELEYCDELGTESPKNYQIWHMRRELVTMVTHMCMCLCVRVVSSACIRE
jgi:hypothetical protein